MIFMAANKTHLFYQQPQFSKRMISSRNVDVNGDGIDAIIIAAPISIEINRRRECLIKVSRLNAKYDASLKSLLI